MNEEMPYTKRELDAKFLNIEEALDNHLVILGRIEQKVTLTNGSVAAVKIEQAKQDGYNKATRQAASFAAVVLLGVLGWLLPQFVSLKAQVSSTKQLQTDVQALSNMSIPLIKPND